MTPNHHPSETISLLHEDLAQARRERDEARAIARALRVWCFDTAPAGLITEFDALPWAQDDT